jgi:hypothetical protein
LQKALGEAVCSLTGLIAMAAKPAYHFVSTSILSNLIEVKKEVSKTTVNLRYKSQTLPTCLNITTCTSATKTADIQVEEWIKIALTNTPSFYYKAG